MREIELTEMVDSKGNPITDVTSIVTYQDGIVVATPKGIYTNVKSLLDNANPQA